MSCLPASRASVGLPANSPAAILADVGQFPTAMVPLYLLSAGDSPRLSGLDKAHVRLLAGTQQQWPPILVHRPAMSVIDGAHRLEAARHRGDREIEVSYFDGDEDAAFVLAVRSNVMHGLPLALSDRTAAAARTLGSYPDWSDRAIARATGLAAATVRGIRRRRAGDCAQPSTRIGSDGRMRPVDISERRRLAGYLITKNPAASLREIAREAGISPATVQDVRRQLAGGHDEATPKQPAAGTGTHHVPGHGGREASAAGPVSARQPAVILQYLRRDPSLRSSETGRSMLRWLSIHSTGAEEWAGFLDSLPPHTTILVMEAARGIAHTWTSFADELERRATGNGFERV